MDNLGLHRQELPYPPYLPPSPGWQWNIFPHTTKSRSTLLHTDAFPYPSTATNGRRKQSINAGQVDGAMEPNPPAHSIDRASGNATQGTTCILYSGFGPAPSADDALWTPFGVLCQ